MNRFPPALSFSDNPEIRLLFENIPRANQPVTIICGAGVSLDSGLPNWLKLVDQMLDDADSDYRSWLLADEMDPSRKVSILQALVPEHMSFNDTIRRALYRNTLGRAQPGLLARAIARFAHHACQVGTDVRVATTNFDDLLEQAIQLSSGRPCEPASLHDSKDWEDGPPLSSVLHLHGALPSQGSAPPVGDIVLSEADFFRHGDAVRKVLERILRRSHTIFVGLSMTDRNIVGPLLAPRVRSAGKTFGRYLVVSPEHLPELGPGGEAITADDERLFYRYTRRRTRALSDHLGVLPIFLNSVAQSSQLFIELACATAEFEKYMADESPIRYGRRLIPYVLKINNWLGLTDQAGNPDWNAEAQRRFSDGLRRDLIAQVKPFLISLARDYDHEEARGHEFTEMINRENFAIHQWVRVPFDQHDNPEYSLRLGGTSAYVHHEPWSAELVAPITAEARFPAGQAVYYGLSRVVEKASGYSARPIWKTELACPFGVEIGPAEVTCGAITLSSTLPTSGMGDTSILGRLRPLDQEVLSEKLRQIALNALPPG